MYKIVEQSLWSTSIIVPTCATPASAENLVNYKVGDFLFVQKGTRLLVPGSKRTRKREGRRHLARAKAMVVVVKGHGGQPRSGCTDLLYVEDKKRRTWLVAASAVRAASPLEVLSAAW